jgi:hypothetical protein
MVLELGCGGITGAGTQTNHSQHVHVRYCEFSCVLGDMLTPVDSHGTHIDVAWHEEYGHDIGWKLVENMLTICGWKLGEASLQFAVLVAYCVLVDVSMPTGHSRVQ